MAGTADQVHGFGFLRPGLAFIFGCLLLPLHDVRDVPQMAYNHAQQLFIHGEMDKCEREAEFNYKRYETSNRYWAAKFQLLVAEAKLWGGKYSDTLAYLASAPHYDLEPDETVKLLGIQAAALARTSQHEDAERLLSRAERLCDGKAYRSCGDILRTQGILAEERGRLEEARKHYLNYLAFARGIGDRWNESVALLNLGNVALQDEHYDEAVDWSLSASRLGEEMSNENQTQAALGNRGVAYFELGDFQRALESFEAARQQAARLGILRDEHKWLARSANVYRVAGDSNSAEQAYRQVIDLAKRTDSKQDIFDSLESLAEISIATGKLGDASRYINQMISLSRASGNGLDTLALTFAQGELAAARHDSSAEAMLRSVEHAPDCPPSLQLSAESELAALYESQSDFPAAQRAYRVALVTYEKARSSVPTEDLKLSFGANASDVYRSYVHFLVKHGRSGEALALADQSRARTLADGLGVVGRHADGRADAMRPEQIARTAGATLLFYWLDAKESYLWAITPQKTAIFTLPGESEIAAHVRGFNRAIQQMSDPVETANADGAFLYQALVAPARGAVDAAKPVIVLADGALSGLNFETLPVAGVVDGKEQASGPEGLKDSVRLIAGAKAMAYHAGSAMAPDARAHYLIEDWTMLEAPSLDLLAHGDGAEAAKSLPAARRLLLVGNPVAEDKDFPALPYFGAEMTRVAGHFDAGAVEEIDGARATPAAYAGSRPEGYDYIHFVSHATASQTNPLDSAIILSAPAAASASGAGGVGAYKLYAREIVEHPLHARLVTISACNGSGTRSYAGEGLVGLSWAFLRAGARQVVAALWEASDDSTPRIMDALYGGIAAGKKPVVALRDAKLALLHTKGKFRQPFYWAPFEIYGRE